MSAPSPRCIQHPSFPSPPTPPPTLPKQSPAPSNRNGTLKKLRTISLSLTSTPTPPPAGNPTSPVSIADTSPTLDQHPLPKPWLSTLLSTKFYGPCPHHPSLRKNDLNLFCTTHARKICQYCHQSSHSAPNCTILHVSRYMYHDVLLAKEAAMFLDISDVQSYLNNGNRVVYIDRRAQAKSKLAPHAKACVVCSRTLQEPYRFCSVFCRLAFAKDPAAAESVPVPEATPLVNQVVARKAKQLEGGAVDKAEGKGKKEGEFGGKVGGGGVAKMKRRKRKGSPVRSAGCCADRLVLFHDVDMLM
eukprot:GFKZ01008413.1.p1 GENE.GFKZ01008413.1~~GFKZ01008413.1.p1  ORF type:complete len:322 (-),score=43.88 GFKZ01008413.1:620-1525(-)